MKELSQISDLQKSSLVRVSQHPEIAKFPRPDESSRNPPLSVYDLASPVSNNQKSKSPVIANNNTLKSVPLTNSSHQKISYPEDEASRRAYLLKNLKENNMNTVSTSIDDSEPQDSLPEKTVSWNMFVVVAILFIVGLGGLFAWQASLMVKVVNLESDLLDNVEHTINIEYYLIPGIEKGLSANSDKTNNLKNVVIPGIQSDLLANINKVNNIEINVNQVQKVYFGITPNGPWQVHDARGIFQDIDISGFGLKNPPMVFATLLGTGVAYQTTGATAIYLLTKSSFRIYIRWQDSPTLTPADAQSWNWRFQYAVFSTDL